MKRFLRNIVLWSLPILAVYAFFIVRNAGPTTDFFYNRFTQPKAPSLVAGSSRAAQGIIPTVIDSVLAPAPYATPLFNYAFTIHHSLYGPCYLDALKKKFDGKKGGLFILTVEPFLLSNYKKNFSDQGESFPECELPPSNMYFNDIDPNPEYFIRNHLDDFGKMAAPNQKIHETFLHDDGWLQVNFPFDTALFRRNTNEKLQFYVEHHVATKRYSPGRWTALSETIDYFTQFGTVILVRIPVDAQMAMIEQNFAPDFDMRIHKLAREYQVVYLNYHYLNSSLYYTDGNHLHKSSSRRFSAILAQDLRRLYGR